MSLLRSRRGLRRMAGAPTEGSRMGTAGTARARPQGFTFAGRPLRRLLDQYESWLRRLLPPVLGGAIVVVVLLVERYSPERSPFITLAFGVSAVLPAWLFTTRRTATGLAVLLV